MNRREQNSILDRHERAIAQILTRFRNMVLAAAEPLPQSAVIETAALNRLTMEREAAALITEVEGLLALNREIKALWIRGPLRLPGEDDSREAELDRKAELVTGLYGQIVAMKNRMAADRPAAQPTPQSQSQSQSQPQPQPQLQSNAVNGSGNGGA
ncbi:hypothetical protein F5X99DRAFT_123531 [Biscogniauxia marginata]|nr:hypothetical protein F5X99DRAFT_123531 [Biscogniauxia marginata]